MALGLSGPVASEVAFSALREATLAGTAQCSSECRCGPWRFRA